MSTPVKASGVELVGVEPGPDEVGVGGVSSAATDAPVTGAERLAPAAGVAVRISGVTHATAPAVAKADMRPMA
jgi:hypothetical protein